MRKNSQYFCISSGKKDVSHITIADTKSTSSLKDISTSISSIAVNSLEDSGTVSDENHKVVNVKDFVTEFQQKYASQFAISEFNSSAFKKPFQRQYSYTNDLATRKSNSFMSDVHRKSSINLRCSALMDLQKNDNCLKSDNYRNSILCVTSDNYQSSRFLKSLKPDTNQLTPIEDEVKKNKHLYVDTKTNVPQSPFKSNNFRMSVTSCSSQVAFFEGDNKGYFNDGFTEFNGDSAFIDTINKRIRHLCWQMKFSKSFCTSSQLNSKCEENSPLRQFSNVLFVDTNYWRCVWFIIQDNSFNYHDHDELKQLGLSYWFDFQFIHPSTMCNFSPWSSDAADDVMSTLIEALCDRAASKIKLLEQLNTQKENNDKMLLKIIVDLEDNSIANSIVEKLKSIIKNIDVCVSLICLLAAGYVRNRSYLNFSNFPVSQQTLENKLYDLNLEIVESQQCRNFLRQQQINLVDMIAAQCLSHQLVEKVTKLFDSVWLNLCQIKITEHFVLLNNKFVNALQVKEAFNYYCIL